MELMLSLLAGIVLGGAVASFLLRTRAEADYQRGLGASMAERAGLVAEKSAWIKTEADLRNRLALHEQALQQQRMDTGKLEQQLAALQAETAQERMQQKEKMDLLDLARNTLSQQFKLLANEIMEEKSKRFTEQNKENLGALLSPLQERIQAFSKQVQDTYDKDSKERLTLEVELRQLKELNNRLNQDAVALTRALTGGQNKTQGIWGEMVLERVLENSGLHKGREYRVQVSAQQEGEEGSQRYQPDVVIDLPEGKQLVIDAKVSLNAYTRYMQAEDDTSRELELKAHILSLKTHIKSLSEKRYQDLYQLNTLDFVFMFVPVEPAYLLAVQQDMVLFNEAFEKRIMIVGPSTLLATLRTVASIWRHEYQNQNAQEIARQSGAMYDKFVGLVDGLEKLGKQINQSRDSWDNAMKSLRDGRGNLLTRAEKLRQLGIKANKKMAPHLLGAEADDDEEAPLAELHQPHI